VWTYDPEELGTETLEERKNSVRFLVGDTDTGDQQVQNEEIIFALGQTSQNVYFAGAFVAETIQAKFARFATSEVDRTLRVRYSDLQEHYRNLAQDLRAKGIKYGAGMGVSAGGINLLQMAIARSNPLRPSATHKGEFDFPKGRYSLDE
jgi:hypothetical protein